jgi:hypothetical protein
MTNTTTVYNINELDTEIIGPLTSKFEDPSYKGGTKLVVIGKPGCFAKGTRVMLYNGYVKNVEDVKVGDILMGDDSTPRHVLELCNGFEEMYKIIPCGCKSVTVNYNHILSLMDADGNIRDITVKDYLGLSNDERSSLYWFKAKINFDMPDIPGMDNGMDEFDLDTSMSSMSQSMLSLPSSTKTPTISNLSISTYPSHSPHISNNTSINTHTISHNSSNNTSSNNTSQSQLYIYDNNIPYRYRCGSENTRRKVLRHIIDQFKIDETRTHDVIQLTNVGLMKDVSFISSTLGRSLNVKIVVQDKITYICEIPKDVISPRYTFLIQKMITDEYFGFIIDGNHRFVLEDCSVVHNTGKSTLIKSILHSKKHIFPVAMVFSGTEDSNHNYSEYIPSSFIYNEYNEDKISEFIKRQKLAIKHLKNPYCALVIDDCTDDNKIFNKPIQQGLFKRGRHWSMLYILSLQYAMDIKPSIRTNIDGVFILREPILKTRKVLYDNYASIIPDFNIFCELMDNLTDDFCAMYIHNTTVTNNWEECVYWYKADKSKLEGWKLGSDVYMDHHNQRYNSEYVDPIN